MLAAAKLRWVLAALCASAGAIYFRAQRWRILLRPVADVPLGPAFSTTAIGVAATSVLPLRLGELIRPALLARRVGFGVSAALSSVGLGGFFVAREDLSLRQLMRTSETAAATAAEGPR